MNRFRPHGDQQAAPSPSSSPPRSSSLPSSPGVTEGGRRERARIWIVDDSPLEIEMAKRALSELYEVSVFGDGASMLEARAAGQAPDALVLDCQLPGMSGVEVCRFLRVTTDEVVLPIVMLTVQGHKQDVVEGLAAGANDYVTKPYDAAELLARVGTLVRTKRLYERVKRAERACAVERGRLAESEQRLRMVSEAIPQIVWTATPEGAIDFVNRRWFALTGVTLEEVQASGWQTIVHPDDRPGAAASFARSMETGEVYDVQLRLRRAADGEHPWYLARALPLRDAEGRITKWFGTFTDIDAQKRTEAQIDAVLEGSPVGIGFLDRGLRFLRVNEALALAHGLSKEAHVGRSLGEVAPEETPPVAETLSLFQRVLSTGEGWSNQELTIFKGAVPAGAAEGERRYLASYFPIRVSGQTIGLAMVTTDVTERRRAEQEREALTRTGRELSEQNRQMKEANRLKREFVSNLSHELRTPLNSIIGFAQTVRSSKVGLSEEHKVYLDDILTSSKHLLQLINDVLDLSRIESGRIELRPQAIDIGRTVAEVRDILRGVAGEKGMLVNAEIHGNLSDIVLDPVRLKQVLYNYLSNAIKFTPDGGQVKVRVKPEGRDAFRIDVVDTGIGVREEDLHRLFVEFQQLDQTIAGRYPGTGLGLSLTKRIVEAQGGTVAVQSSPGKGSTFSAILPRSRGA